MNVLADYNGMQEKETPLPALKSKTLVTAAKDELRDAILIGRLKPGERLVEEELASEFGVSRSTVREALQALAGEGLVIKRSHRGTYVTELGWEDLVEIYELRKAIEGFAVCKLCETLKNEQRQHLQALIDEMQSIAKTSDSPTEALSQLDMNFHKALCQFAGNKYMMAAWSNMGNHLFMYFARALTAFKAYTYHERHQRILDAILLRDPNGALLALEYHLDSALALYAPTINMAW